MRISRAKNDGGDQARRGQAHDLAELAKLTVAEALARMGSAPEGISAAEAEVRRDRFGANVIADEARPGRLRRLAQAIANPLVILLLVLATIEILSGDPRAAAVMGVMVLLGVVLRFVQESRADDAAARLKAMIRVTATVRRGGLSVELPLAEIVPGDVVELAAGDMIPADVRLLAAKDLFVAQASLTGESLPVEKDERPDDDAARPLIERRNLAFLGTSVQSGTGTVLVFATGSSTRLGRLARSLQSEPPTAFDRGIGRFTWLMIRFMAVMVPLVFVINGLTKGDWVQAFFFAVADARDAADDCDGLSGAWGDGDVAAEGHREAAGGAPGPRRDGRAMHGQDGHADTGSNPARAALRRGAQRRRGSPGARLPEQPFPDRTQECAGPRDPPAPGAARASGDCKLREAGRDTIRFRAAVDVGRGERRGRSAAVDHERSAGVGLSEVRSLRAGWAMLRNDAVDPGRPTGRVRGAECRRVPGACPGIPRARAEAGLRAGGRAGARAAGIPGISRPTA